ncbi:MAG: AMP-dependent synthetase/ligase [Micrococcaceae bacterium]
MMQEVSSAKIVNVEPDSNITDLLEKKVRSNPRYEIYSRKLRGSWVDVTVKKFHADVRLIAKSLIEKGYKPGDRIAIMAPTRYEWSLVDFAMWYAGIISVPIFETSSGPQIEWILEDSNAKAAIVDNEDRANQVSAAANNAGIALNDIWTFESSELGTNYETLLAKTDITDEQLEEVRSAANLDSVATLVYTSGTTGKSKGCELTHGNFVEIAENIILTVPEFLVPKENSRTIMFLPLAHALARAVQICCLAAEINMSHGSMANILEDFKSYKPTWLLVVPRVLEKVYGSALSQAESKGQGKIFKRGYNVAVQYSKQKANGSVSFNTKMQQRLFDRLIYQKLRKALGGHCKYIVSGASALNPELIHFFTGAGMPILEGYGLTETTAPLSLNTPEHTNIGTVGRLSPGNEARISEDGEVLVRGVGVFKGYWKNKKATEEAFSEGSWFKTGDLGTINEDGFLKITGRKKDIIVTAGGKNVYPNPMEDGINSSLIVEQALIVGENKPFVSALVTLDKNELENWCRNKGFEKPLSVEEATTHPQVIAEIQSKVYEVNENVSRAESIRKFKIISDSFTVESGHMTPTMKLKRLAALKDFEDQVETMYKK